MELRHIRYFLAVANERNFTRAAARIGIGQPPLSQQIRDLETEIGAPLFHRVPHGAELTAAGEAFLQEARPIMVAAEKAKEAAQRAHRGKLARSLWPSVVRRLLIRLSARWSACSGGAGRM